jgi:hypothetical protein
MPAGLNGRGQETYRAPSPHTHSPVILSTVYKTPPPSHESSYIGTQHLIARI